MNNINVFSNIQSDQYWTLAPSGQVETVAKEAAQKGVFWPLTLAKVAYSARETIRLSQATEEEKFQARNNLQNRIVHLEQNMGFASKILLWICGYGTLRSISRTIFIDGLQDWVSHAVEGQNRREAARRITEVYDTNYCILDLGGLRLGSLPREIGMLTEITYLNIASNRLTSLPTEIGNLTELGNLNASNNLLRSLPREIGNLTHLAIVRLDNNAFSEIPEELRHLAHSLCSLHLGTNSLMEFPKWLSEMTRLEFLNLSDNLFSSIPEGGGNCEGPYIDLSSVFPPIATINLTLNNLPEEVIEEIQTARQGGTDDYITLKIAAADVILF